MERTLYLSEQAGLRVKRDGPSLWIEQPGRAGRRVPARLIRRVLIAGNVALDTASLALFAERGVPIALLDRRGEAIAAVVGWDGGDLARRARQWAAWEDTAVCDRLSAWLAAWERGRRLTLVRRFNHALARQWRTDGFRSTDYERWLSEIGLARGAQRHVRSLFHAALQAVILTESAAAGWDPHAGVRHRHDPLGFVKDGASAVNAEADALWLDTAPHGPEAPGPLLPEPLVEAFERRRPLLERLVRRWLDQFERILWEG